MTGEKTLCPHGWPERLQPCLACTMDQSVCDAMDSSRTEPRRFTGLGGIPVVEDKNILEGKAFVFGVDLANGPDKSFEIKYQLKDEGGEAASTTDKQDPKNTRGDWFNPFGSDLTVRRLEAELSEHAKINIRLIEVVESSQEEIDRLRNEIALLKLAARCAGDEIRARKPERHSAYWLTFPECGPSAGMYWAMAWLLAAGGLLLAWGFA